MNGEKANEADGELFLARGRVAELNAQLDALPERAGLFTRASRRVTRFCGLVIRAWLLQSQNYNRFNRNRLDTDPDLSLERDGMKATVFALGIPVVYFVGCFAAHLASLPPLLSEALFFTFIGLIVAIVLLAFLGRLIPDRDYWNEQERQMLLQERDALLAARSSKTPGALSPAQGGRGAVSMTSDGA